ncbi:MAG TPA: hypothetical protein VKZ63_09305 [Kofleriaceae bacterium]|nr:hypothetical protein [Kofleriaceae bacterium]
MRLVRAATCALALACAAGCADDGLDAESSRAVFEAANGEIHALHLEALAFDLWPATYVRACADGGDVTMESELIDGHVFVALYHAFDGCQAGGYTLDGAIDYTEISFCDDDTANVTITGELVVAGHGPCAIDAVETCGAVAGTACGAAL